MVGEAYCVLHPQKIVKRAALSRGLKHRRRRNAGWVMRDGHRPVCSSRPVAKHTDEQEGKTHS